MPTHFAATKLRAPGIRGAIPRHSLYDDLAGSIQRGRLTLISAPAGAGKTTLVAGFLEHRPDLRAAWISLDHHDNNPAIFINLLIAALQTCDAHIGQHVLPLVQATAEVDPARLMAILADDLPRHDPLVLVLDDLHSVQDMAILAALDDFLAYLPDTVHVIITARHDPPLSLAR